MTIQRLRIALIVCGLLAANVAFGSARQSSPKVHRQRASHTITQLPFTTTDNWLGGMGFWSDQAYWDAGVPGLNSDVFINTGSDYVVLDTGPSIASLTLGGISGSSILEIFDNKSSLSIAGALNIRNSGYFHSTNQQYGSSLSAGSLSNQGSIVVQETNISITQNLSNSGHILIEDSSLTAGRVLYNTGSIAIYELSVQAQIVADNVFNSGEIDISGTPLPFGFNDLSTNGMFNGGRVSVGQGNSLFAATFVNSGKLDNAGTVDIGEYSQLSHGVLEEEIGAGYFGVITDRGSASLNGTLSILLDNGFVPEIGSAYEFIFFAPGEMSGEFTTIENQYFNNNHEVWQIDYNNAGGFIQLTAVATPEPRSILLLGSGLLAMSAAVRRRLRL